MVGFFGRNADVADFMNIPLRSLVFLLAFQSIACLLGAFYGFWHMRPFACWVMLPSAVALAVVAVVGGGRGVRSPRTWVVEGTLGGLCAAVAYDLFRLPFVLNGAPLFNVFPRFGELLLNAGGPRWLVQLTGWTYHFSNGAALGIMFLALSPTATRRGLFWGAVAWALAVETVLLLTPYTQFLGLPFDGRFVALTASAHAVFGVALGLWCARRLGRPAARPA
jgi:hypothetical protein